MKGTNTLILNKRQVMQIIQKWWDDGTYSHMDDMKVIVADFFSADGNTFEVTLDEVEQVEEQQ